MDFKDIQTEYKNFIEHIYSAHSHLENLIPELSIFLSKYCKSKNYSEDFAQEIDNNLTNFENIFIILDDLLEKIETITFNEVVHPEKTKN